MSKWTTPWDISDFSEAVDFFAAAAQSVPENLTGHGDASDFLLKYHNIEFYSVPTQVNVKFKAFVTAFTDSFEVRWDSVTAQGRMDPIQAYQGTGRKITLEWDVVANGLTEAINNLQKCERLVQMMYPVFQRAGGKGTSRIGEGIGAPPYIKTKFGNLIKKSHGAGDGTAAQSGLLCTPAGIDYSPDFDVGVFTSSGGQIYPKKVSLSLELTVQHEHQLGYSNRGSDDRQGAFVGFPYNSTVTKNILRSNTPGAPETQGANTPKPNSGGDVPQAVVDAETAAAKADTDVEPVSTEEGLSNSERTADRKKRSDANSVLNSTANTIGSNGII